MAEAVFRKPNVAEGLSWTPENVDSLVEVLGIRNMCRHLNEGQILTTTTSINLILHG